MAAYFLNYELLNFYAVVLGFDDAVKRAPGYALAYLQRGKLLFARQQTAGLKIRSGFELGWIGITRTKTAGDDRAISDFSKAIFLDTQREKAYRYRAGVYAAIKEYDKAIADYTQRSELTPNLAGAYSGLGNVYDDKGDYDRAIAGCNQAIKLRLCPKLNEQVKPSERTIC